MEQKQAVQWHFRAWRGTECAKSTKSRCHVIDFFFMWPRNMQQSHTHASSIWQHRIWDIPPYAGLTYRMMRPISFHLDFVFSFINCIRHRISQYSALLLLITQAKSRDAVFWFAVSPRGTTPKEQAKQINWMSRNAESGKLELSIL